MIANITVQEMPGQIFTGKVLSTSNKLDSSSRTMLTQIIIPNTGNKLYPGLFAMISLNLDKNSAVMTIPDNAVISTDEGLKVITVNSNNCFHYVSIKIGRDYGDVMEVKEGLKGDEILVRNPVDSMKEGQKASIMQEKN